MTHFFGKVKRPPRAMMAPLGYAARPLIQPKLRVGAPNDSFEREADSVAARVTAGRDAGPISSLGGTPLQRRCAECEEEEAGGKADVQRQEAEEEEEMMQAKGKTAPQEEEEAQAKADIQREPEEEEEALQMKPQGSGGFAANASASRKIQSLRGGGQPLPSGVRNFYEGKFGADFSNVRIHSGRDGDAAARSINARAFTTGSDIAFRNGEYAPGGSAGSKLLAHELTHVVQQSGGKQVLQRKEAAGKAPKVLTSAEIKEAMGYNKRRYNAVSTRFIQARVGAKVTGIWSSAFVQKIAKWQWGVGLTEDGKVGKNSFQKMDKQASAAKLDKTDKNCLTSLRIKKSKQTITPNSGGAGIHGYFRMKAMLPPHCNCKDYEYRQFIRGHFNHIRGTTTTDEADWFGRIPGGRLPSNFREDGDTAASTVNYGRRSQPREDANPINRYENFNGTPNQKTGCIYTGEDGPGGTYTGWHASPTTGDILDVLVEFRGEIQRKGRTVRSKRWTAIKSRFTLP